MNQGAFLVAVLAGALVLHLARTGRLIAYTRVITGGSAAQAGGATGGGLG